MMIADNVSHEGNNVLSFDRYRSAGQRAKAILPSSPCS
jgi:hypothetical protein